MLPLLVVAVVSLLAVGAFNYDRARRQTESRVEQQLQGVVTVLSNSSYPLTGSVLQQMGGLANARFILTDHNGNVLASGQPIARAKLPASPHVASSAADVRLGTELVLDGKTYFHSAAKVRGRPGPGKEGVLHVLFAKEEFDAAWRSAFFPSVIVGFVTLAAVALVIHLLASRISNALSSLGNEVQRLAEGDFSPVQVPSWNDEAQDLAVAINRTAGRLAEYETALRQTERLRTVSMLGAGLAHELRNAATGCRLAVDLHVEKCAGVEHDESLQVARRQLAFMESRLQQLLQLGRQSTATSPLEPAPTQSPSPGAYALPPIIDLNHLVSESVKLLEPAARHASVSLTWSPLQAKVPLHASSDLLGQAIMNLLLNALDAASKSQTGARNQPHGSFVNVSLQVHGQTVELVVADSGEGPPEELAAKVFDPFVTTKPEGVGLGLAVAKRVVESYNGQLAWDRQANTTRFIAGLPLAQTSPDDSDIQTATLAATGAGNA